jgi:hypothetical protein
VSIEETAWLAALAIAIPAVLAIRFLGPPLASALLRPAHAYFWMTDRGVRPEPVEQARFLIALSVPLALAALTAAGARLRLRARPQTTAMLVVAAQVIGIAFAVACLLRQHSVFGPLYPEGYPGASVENFRLPALFAAVAGAALLVVAVRSARVRDAWDRWSPDTRARRAVATCIAVAATAVWLLHAAYTEGTIGQAFPEVIFNIQFTLDETFAVLNGLTPLVDFVTQYGALWPYPYAAGMSVLGTSIGVWVTLVLCTTGLGMLATFGILRRAAGSSIGGLLLFLPVLASSFLTLEGTSVERSTYGDYYGTFPLRYAGPALLAWLVARQLSGERPRRTWPLFFAAGLVALNNVDAGLPALGATAAAVLWAETERNWASLRRRTLEVAGGLASALVVVSILTLARTGQLPDVGLLFRFPRLFGRVGYALFPMPTLGLHDVIYLTYVAAIGVATVRRLRAAQDRLLTGMLAWSGVFGLGVGAYFTGRSTPDDLPAMFFPWSLTLMLLLVPALRTVRDASWRRPPIAATACLFGYVLLLSSLAQTPAPWTQIERLQRTAAPVLAQPTGQDFIAQRTRPHESVLILGMLSHRIGANLGISNVSPYTNSNAMLTAELLQDAIAALRGVGGRKVFVDLSMTSGDFQQAVERAGFALTAVETGGRMALFSRP